MHLASRRLGELPAGLGLDCYTTAVTTVLQGKINKGKAGGSSMYGLLRVTCKNQSCVRASDTSIIFAVLHRPKDFVVTELLSDGQLVTLNGAVTPYQTDASNDALLGSEGPLSNHLKTNDNPQTRVQLCEDDPSSGPTKHQTNQSDTRERPLSIHQSPNLTTIPHLEKLVSPDVYQQLVSMAAVNSATTSTEPPSSLNLGERR